MANLPPKYDPLRLLDEPIEETAKRLRALAREELNEAVSSGEAVATAFDGSLSTGKFWPSSDLDITMVSPDPKAEGLRGGVRAGIGVHWHVQAWESLERLREDWPGSWAIAPDKKWYWLQDEIWLLDGIASMTPVHDPDGRLASLKEFVLARRFEPEGIRQRWPVILQGAADAAKDGYLHAAAGLLGSIWFEAAGRIISGKEMDPQLRAACASLGAPQAHGLFRRVAGVDSIEGREAEFALVCRAMLGKLSPWVDLLLEKAPFKVGGIEDPIPSVMVLRQMIWSGIYAPAKGCLMHLATIRTFLNEHEAGPAILMQLASGPGGKLLERLPEIEEARHEILGLFPSDPAPQLAALEELMQLTRRTFSI